MKVFLRIVALFAACAAVMGGIASLGGVKFLPQFGAAFVMLVVVALSTILGMAIGMTVGKKLTGEDDNPGMPIGFLLGMFGLAPSVIAFINHVRH